ncbi:uncharacterized protein P884DRAFT_273565 [Thermothelomyces heterothallicus CBS 202.75]|uniref:uncharacterized protein n=1 Tax=Thermothelomyces heterothallicus CBS 202.75 TaxID=1149848 RepID=UPI00374335F0
MPILFAFCAARYTCLCLTTFCKVKFGASDLNLLKVFKSAERVTESDDASAPASPVQQPTEPAAPAPTATLTASSEAATPRPSARKAASKPAPKRKEPFFDPKKENWSALETWKPILFPYKPQLEMTEDQQVEAEDFKANQRTYSLKGQTLRYGFNRANNTKVTAVLGFKDIKTCLT